MVCLISQGAISSPVSAADNNSLLPESLRNPSGAASSDEADGPVKYEAVDEVIIRSIDIRGLNRVEKEEFIDLINLSVGDRLDRTRLARGVRRAFRKGTFQDIKILSEPYDGGVRLTCAVKEVPLVKKITLEGNEKIASRTIRQKFYYKEGEAFRDQYVNRARQSLAELYKRKGFPDAQSTIIVEQNEGPSVDVRVVVIEGEPLLVNEINVTSEVRQLMSLKEGRPLDTDKINKDIRSIKKYYEKKGYSNPKAGPYEFSSGKLTIPVDPGQRIDVEFINNTALRSKKLKKELFFISDEDLTDESIAEASERIRRLYVSLGYYYAQVAAGTERSGDTLKISFIIFEGKRVTLREVTFSGASISSGALKKIIPLKEDKPFNGNLLEESREAVVRFYNALGYLQAEVAEVHQEFRNDERDLSLDFVIREGPQTTIHSLEIFGNDLISLREIGGSLRLKEGMPYNVTDIADARRRVLSLYSRKGFLDAHVEIKSRFDQGRAFLTINIKENIPVVIGKIVLRGNNKTKPKIIRRELTLREGDRYSTEEITKMKQRLYRIGIFNEVTVSLIEPGYREKGVLIKDMLVSVRETKAGTVEFSLGYGDYERVRGGIDVRYRNLGGYNRQAGFRAELNSVEKKYIFNFREPWLFNQPDLPLKIYLIREERRATNVDSREVLYKIDKQSFIAGVEKELSRGLKVGLDYEYSFTDTKNVESDVILSREDTGTLGIGSISPSLFYDRRDNPFNPLSGSFHSITLKYASPVFLSETEFIKGSLLSSWYWQLMDRIVFAFSLRGGAAYGFDETEEIPLIERFFLGGRSTVRGYKYDALGPKGEDDNPTGGNIFALINGELRFSLQKGFGLVTFVDAGNVWQTFDEVDDKLKYTLGAGLRYNTPIGPVRVDYGHKMNKEEGESSGEVHFSFGHAF